MSRVRKRDPDAADLGEADASDESATSTSKQIHPSITRELDERINKLAAKMRTDKATIVNASLEYGAWNFKKAWTRYLSVRQTGIEDDDDTIAAAEADAGNVVKLAPTKDAKT